MGFVKENIRFCQTTTIFTSSLIYTRARTPFLPSRPERMSDDAAEMAALAAEFGLSDRGAQATKPPFSYLHAFFKAIAEPWEEGTRDGRVGTFAKR
jgi:hypothetical protein